MPKNPDIKKVLVLGSGPIVIGQAAEFDYAGTQACRSLKEEGIEVVLLNSNPATIMTDKDIADRVYIEPLTLEVVEQLIKKEKPDSVLPTLGGQAGLNLAMELEEAGFLKENNVRLIGTTALTIKKAEDREMFKETMEKIGLYIMIFSILALYLSALPDSLLPLTLRCALLGAVEITTGIQAISGSVPGFAGALLITAAGAFGGISGIFQTKSVLKSAGLSIRHYILWKFFHSVLSCAAFALCFFINQSLQIGI